MHRDHRRRHPAVGRRRRHPTIGRTRPHAHLNRSGQAVARRRQALAANLLSMFVRRSWQGRPTIPRRPAAGVAIHRQVDRIQMNVLEGHHHRAGAGMLRFWQGSGEVHQQIAVTPRVTNLHQTGRILTTIKTTHPRPAPAETPLRPADARTRHGQAATVQVRPETATN
jgi:hypothetical protein